MIFCERFARERISVALITFCERISDVMILLIKTSALNIDFMKNATIIYFLI